MKSLIEALADDTEQRRQAAVGTYRELLHRGDEKFSDADLAKFKDAAELLGKNLEAVSSDYRVVAEARRWAEQANTIDREHAAHLEADKALRDHVAEMARVQAEMQRRRNELTAELHQAYSRLGSAREAQRRLKDLKLRHGAVLVGIDCNDPDCDRPTPLEQGGPFLVFH
jgi:hypothetical protein